MKEVWSDVDHWIYITKNGGITYDTCAEKAFNEAGGDFQTLFLAIEDNIVTDEGDETIDWSAVEKYYEKMVQDPNWKDNHQYF